MCLHIPHLFALDHAVQWRLGDINVAALDEVSHVAEQEGQQQRTNVAAVNVSVGQNNHFVVASFVGSKLIVADSAADCRD